MKKGLLLSSILSIFFITNFAFSETELVDRKEKVELRDEGRAVYENTYRETTKTLNGKEEIKEYKKCLEVIGSGVNYDANRGVGKPDWKKSEVSLKTSGNSNTSFESTQSPLEISFPKNTNGSINVKKNKSSISFQFLNAKNVNIKKDNDQQVSYDAPFDNTKVEYKLSNGSLKEDIILSDKTAPKSYSFRVNLNECNLLDGNNIPVTDPKSFISPSISPKDQLTTFMTVVDKNGENLFYIFEGIAIDADENIYPLFVTAQKNNNDIILKYSLTDDCLKKAKYPIRIDPTIVNSTSYPTVYKSGVTYFIQDTIVYSYVSNGSPVVFEAGAIVKTDITSSGAWIRFNNRNVEVKGTPHNYVYFTAARDDSVGEDTDGIGSPFPAEANPAQGIHGEAFAVFDWDANHRYSIKVDYGKFEWAHRGIAIWGLDDYEVMITNSIFKNHRQVGISLGFVYTNSTFIFHNNIFKDINYTGSITTAGGILLHSEDITNSTFDITNNTFYNLYSTDNDCDFYGVSIGPSSNSLTTGMVRVKNNIISGTSSNPVDYGIRLQNQGSATVDIDNNGYYNVTTEETGFTSTHSATVTTNPFVSNDAGTLFLDQSCAFIDAGTSSTYDLNLYNKTTAAATEDNDRIITDDITTSATWTKIDRDTAMVDLGYHYSPVDYILKSSSNVSNYPGITVKNTGTELAIDPGVVIAFSDNVTSGGLYKAYDQSLIAEDGGSIIALGDTKDRIVFASTITAGDRAGNSAFINPATTGRTVYGATQLYNSIYIKSDAGDSNAFQYCNFYNANTGLYLDSKGTDTNYPIKNCVFQDTYNAGINAISVNQNITNNLFIHNKGTAIKSSNCDIVANNNTIDDSEIGIEIDNEDFGADDGTLYNNIVTSATYGIKSLDTITTDSIENNCLYNNTTNVSGFTAPSSTIYTDPLFTSNTNSNYIYEKYYLTQTSNPCVDGGKTSISAYGTTSTTYSADTGTVDVGYHNTTDILLSFESGTSSGSENQTTVQIPVTLNRSSSSTITLDYSITGGTANRYLSTYANYAEWKYKKKITVDHTKVAGDLTNFPVLIEIDNDSNLSTAQSNGNDILFTDSQGNKLSHEIEEFVQGSGKLVAWVKVPTLLSTQDTILYIYYGNSTCSNQQDINNVWDNNYRAVYHMEDNTSNTVSDSTSNSFDGTKKANNEPTNSTGKIFDNQDFDGTNDYINATQPFDGIGDFTFSAWIKTNMSSSLLGDIVSERVNINNNQYNQLILTRVKYGLLDFSIRNATPVLKNMSTANTYNDGNWHYVVFQRSGSGMIINADGGQEIVTLNDVPTDDVVNSTTILKIGAYQNTTYLFDGNIDEVRILNIAKSASWISTEYNNQNDPTSFITLSPQMNAYYDYEITEGSLTFSSGEITKNINLTIYDDNIYEDDETIEISLSNLNGASAGTYVQHVFTITDNETPPTINFENSASSGSEGTTPASIKVQLDKPSYQSITVNYNITGGTADSFDYQTNTTNPITFNPFQTEETINLNIIEDNNYETDESITIELSDPAGATLGSTSNTTFTIKNNDMIFDINPVQRTDGSGIVDVHYTGKGNSSVLYDLITTKYTKDNVDYEMTEATGEGNGKTDLTFSDTGSPLTYTWNSKAGSDNSVSNIIIKLQASGENIDSQIVQAASFTLDNLAPQSVTAIYPVNEAINIPTNTVTIEVTDQDNNSMEYKFELSNDNTFAAENILQERDWLAGNTWIINNLSGDIEYFWRVKAKDSFGNQTDWHVYSFTTNDLPEILNITPVQRTNGSGIVDINYIGKDLQNDITDLVAYKYITLSDYYDNEGESYNRYIKDYSGGNRDLKRMSFTDTSISSGYFGSSLYGDGYPNIAGAESIESLLFNTQEITMEAYIYPTSGMYSTINYRILVKDRIENNTEEPAYSMIWLGGEIRVYIYMDNGTYKNYCTTSADLTTNNWYHVAATTKVNESGGTDIKIFVNGVLEYSYTETGLKPGLGDAGPLYILRYPYDSDHNFKGKIDEVRISNIACYDSSFTPPTQPFTLTDHTLVLYHFDNEEQEYDMTPKTDDPQHDGAEDLAFTDAGTTFTFCWNSQSDLPITEKDCKIKLQANDGNGNGAVYYSEPILVDNCAPRAISSSPNDNATTITTTTFLKGDALDSSLPIEYLFRIAEDDTYTSPTTQVSDWITTNAWQPENELEKDTQYYWQYKMKDALGNISNYYPSDNLTFTTYLAPRIESIVPYLYQDEQIKFQYLLKDDYSHTINNLIVQYSIDGGITFHNAAHGTDDDGIINLNTSPSGIIHAYSWAFGTDIDENQYTNSDFIIKMVPDDGFVQETTVYYSNMFFLY